MEKSFPKCNIRRQVHSGPAGLNIPKIPLDAEDEDLLAALANLTNAKKILKQRRKGLHNDAWRIGKDFGNRNGLSATVNLKLDIDIAYRLSINIQRGLFHQKHLQLTSMQKQLNQLCR